MSYNCYNCGEVHDTGIPCPNTILNEKEKYQKELIIKFDSFCTGYGDIILVHFSDLRRKLFGEGLFDKANKQRKAKKA